MTPKTVFWTIHEGYLKKIVAEIFVKIDFYRILRLLFSNTWQKISRTAPSVPKMDNLDPPRGNFGQADPPAGTTNLDTLIGEPSSKVNLTRMQLPKR